MASAIFSQRLSSESYSIMSRISMFFSATSFAISEIFIFARFLAFKELSFFARFNTNTAFPKEMLFSLANVDALLFCVEITWCNTAAFMSSEERASSISSTTSLRRLSAFFWSLFWTVTNTPLVSLVMYPCCTMEPTIAFNATCKSTFCKSIPERTFSPSELVA